MWIMLSLSGEEYMVFTLGICCVLSNSLYILQNRSLPNKKQNCMGVYIADVSFFVKSQHLEARSR